MLYRMDSGIRLTESKVRRFNRSSGLLREIGWNMNCSY
jgi:hypothetical protein